MIAILYREELKEYDFGVGHPFRGSRYVIFPRFLKSRLPENDNYRILEADWATDEDLLTICEREYIEFTKEYYRAVHKGLRYDGRFYRFHSEDNRPGRNPGKLEEAARLIIGQAKLAADLIQEGKFRKVVSIGGGMHHAKKDYGEGFCIYNDVAFTARYLIEKHGLKRVLVIDTDAHAGNGTCEYFYSDPRVLFIDLHQDPSTIYPGTGFASEIGSGEGRGYTINIPMPLYSGYASYQKVFEEVVQPVTEEFKPQIIIRNGGSDPHFDDPLTRLGLPVEGFRMIGEKVRALAEVCGGKEIDLIASGYNEKVLPHAWLALISGLAGFKVEVREPTSIPERITKRIDPIKETENVIEEVKRNLKDYWRSLH